MVTKLIISYGRVLKMTDTDTNILELPFEVLEKILSSLPYKTISEIRIVCKTFDSICKELLNKGFKDSITNYYNVLDSLKRITSDKNDLHILKNSQFFTTSLDITVIDLTFRPYINLKTCCFSPGLLIDKIDLLSSLIEKSIETNDRIDFFAEYFDFNAMQRKAIRHFVNKIIPGIESKVIEKDLIIAQLRDELNSIRI